MYKNLLFSNVLKNQFSSLYLANKNFEKNLINSNSQLNIKRNSRVLRRRITRIENDYEVSEEEIQKFKLSENDEPSMKFISKNPRNLEQLLFEQKPLGWELEEKNKSYWNKLEIDKVKNSIVCRVVHNSGKVLLQVSDNDESLKKFVVNEDSLTVLNFVGQIFARRCFESGIQYLHYDKTNQMSSFKFKALLDSLKKNGLILTEPEFFVPRRPNKDL